MKDEQLFRINAIMEPNNFVEIDMAVCGQRSFNVPKNKAIKKTQLCHGSPN